ncbi:acetoacetate decarboxylase family protein [Nostoc sp. FACHB-133]|uniref:acetoacetate decarboxylase family protein n=1 Tax=Nostoc sp. FACHB-133 TaxID=2692835 RepID=UPI001682C26D|nr:acetoacetate decarboxylase family protein [Nostoc sp. FACHB-133]MBD2523654.1 acetoacetate decarboxylase family protein [Nostoc sp. FACHB-133]
MMPQRLKQQTGLYALVDGIPFQLPVNSEHTPALMAVFTINADRAKELILAKEVHPLRLWNNQGLLVITVINYQITDIGKYIEFSIAIACTHGAKPAPPLLPGLLMQQYGTGQYVLDLPVSTEISVKGGKGIWGMPKHQANLDFVIGDRTVSSQYDLDGQLVMKIEVAKPAKAWFPLKMGAANYCAFRGMLMKSVIYFQGKLGFSLFKPGSAKLTIGDHPRIQPLKHLEISPEPIFTGFFPEITGMLDDHLESWFLGYDIPPTQQPEGLESVVNLGLGQEWLPAPKALPKDDQAEMYVIPIKN